MISMGFQVLLAMLFLYVATAKATERVTFEGEMFSMTCPSEGSWYKNNITLDEYENLEKLEFSYSSATKGLYRCEYKETVDSKERKKYFFYVKGKACAGCVELDALTFLLVIIADVVGTVILMVIIYKCTKKISYAKPTQTPKAAARSGGHAPPVASSAYEQLNPRTRSSDTYTVVNRMG